MKLDRRLTNGLAWAGALIVIGIPAADYLTGTFSNGGTPSVAVVDAKPETPAASQNKPAASVTPAEKPAAIANAGDPVGGFVQSGKPLPSYITGGDAPAAATKPAATAMPQPVSPKPATTQPSRPAETATPPATATRPAISTAAPAEQVAALPPKTAPIPMPLSMRPRPVSVPLASGQPPLIIDQPTNNPNLPPASLPQAQPMPNDVVTSQDLDTWESGPLSEFLARRGQGGSRVTYDVQRPRPQPQPQQPAYGYDSNGFWLDQAPRGDQPVGRYGDDDVIYLPY